VSGLQFAAVNTDGVVADLDLLPAAYRVLLKLRAHSRLSGRRGSGPHPTARSSG
jgi:hypothetical protein